MNILVLGASFLSQALSGLGHAVFSVGLEASATLQVTHPMVLPELERRLAGVGFVPDCALLVDNGNLPFLIGIEALPCPSLLYSIDTFCNPWHVPYSYAFDAALAAQKEYAALLPELGGNKPGWLPLFAPDMPVSGGSELRDIPVSFVGTLRPRNIPQRFPFLERFRRLQPLVMRQGAYAPVFSRSRIVLNQTAAEEVNFRCFESMLCGAALLTEDSPQGLRDLFTPGMHILPPYRRGDAAHAAAIAREWLARPEDTAAVAAAGCELVRARHTATARALTVAGMLEQLIAMRAQQQRLVELPRRRHLLATAYAILSDELQAPGLSPHQDLYRRLFTDSIPMP